MTSRPRHAADNDVTPLLQPIAGLIDADAIGKVAILEGMPCCLCRYLLQQGADAGIRTFDGVPSTITVCGAVHLMSLLMQAAIVCDSLVSELILTAVMRDAVQGEPSKAMCAIDVAVEKVCRPTAWTPPAFAACLKSGCGCCQVALGCLCSCHQHLVDNLTAQQHSTVHCSHRDTAGSWGNCGRCFRA